MNQCFAQEKQNKQLNGLYQAKYIKGTIYKGNETKIEIICKKHGVFTQTPHAHNSGSGCNICGSETRGASRRLFVGKKTILYYIKIQNLFKIGITRTSIKQRMYGEKYELIDSWIFNNGEEAFDIEKKILEKTKE